MIDCIFQRQNHFFPLHLVSSYSGGAVVKNPPATAGIEHGFDPWSGKIPQATEQQSPCATTTEAHAPRAGALQQEKPLLAATRESSRAAMKTQHSQK